MMHACIVRTLILMQSLWIFAGMTCTLCLAPCAGQLEPRKHTFYGNQRSNCIRLRSAIVGYHRPQALFARTLEERYSGPCTLDTTDVSSLPQRDDDNDIRANRCAKQTTCTQTTDLQALSRNTLHMQFVPKLKHGKNRFA